MKTLEEIKEDYLKRFTEESDGGLDAGIINIWKMSYDPLTVWQFIEEAIKEAMSWAEVDGKIRGYAAAQKDWEAGLWEDKAAH